MCVYVCMYRRTHAHAHTPTRFLSHTCTPAAGCDGGQSRVEAAGTSGIVATPLLRAAGGVRSFVGGLKSSGGDKGVSSPSLTIDT